MSLLHAIGLVVFVVVVKEMIYFQIEASRSKETEFTSCIDFSGLQKRVTRFFSFIAVVIWADCFFDNLSAMSSVLTFTTEFLTQERQLLNASFTFESIAVFFVVVYLSSILANNIAYFAQIKDQQHAEERNKRLGSQILLIRLGIPSLGLLLAIAASGIPIDKIAIILGAPSVGIGFGLQAVVNNLVSGVILTFERPIQIGDTIEVGQVEGVEQDIGILASKIKNWDGAEVIIPNGDLLAHHLTNWTLSDKKRRVELIIGVSFNSDIVQVTSIIEKALEMDEILKKPEPLLFLQTVREYNMDFRVLFWVGTFDAWLGSRDQVMRSIY
jgi:small-conductance mechanosensitive channel